MEIFFSAERRICDTLDISQNVFNFFFVQKIKRNAKRFFVVVSKVLFFLFNEFFRMNE